MRIRGRMIVTLSILAVAAMAAVPLLAARGSAHDDEASAQRIPAPRVRTTPHPRMHAVADADWIEGEHAEAFDEDAASCQACHGMRLEGTVRSRVVERRVVRVGDESRPRVIFERGERVACGACHDTPDVAHEGGE